MDYLQYIRTGGHLSNDNHAVLNLVINGLPSIHNNEREDDYYVISVLNLVINGLPSILKEMYIKMKYLYIMF